MQRTNLLAVYSIQTNMLSAIINPENDTECLVLLNTGKTLKVKTDYRSDANEILNTLHFYPVFENRDNNSIEKNFYFTLEIIKYHE